MRVRMGRKLKPSFFFFFLIHCNGKWISLGAEWLGSVLTWNWCVFQDKGKSSDELRGSVKASVVCSVCAVTLHFDRNIVFIHANISSKRRWIKHGRNVQVKPISSRTRMVLLR